MVTTPSAGDLASVVNLLDFERLARTRMEPAAFEFVAGGAGDETSLAEALEAWRRYRFVPRVLVDVRRIDLRGRFLEREATLPIGIAPMAGQAMAHPDAEAAMVRGAGAAGLPMILSTSASLSLEAVAEAGPTTDRLFQLYLVGDLGYTRSLVERAAAAGYRAIVLTVDLPVLGYRDRDRRSGFGLPPMPMVDGSRGTAAEAREDRYAGLDRQRELGLTWDTLAEIQTWSDLPLVLKGVLSPADARLAVETGAAAVIVSTHGARQIDRVIASADALGGVVEAIGGRAEVWVDGGIRRGIDVAVALALGADAVLIGRPFFWALAAGGQAGVERAASILREELEIGLALLGCTSIGDLGPALLVQGA
ncbi:MAG TPA: alpha-hydroxy acid oxidase [Candidatus Limnocylindrales bacterium]|nr:alpha-hydroxy acid oxidase [Candidatus Limnocylindrales bacterium]